MTAFNSSIEEGSERAGDGGLAQSAIVEMGEKTADAHVINVAPRGIADVRRELLEIDGIGLDGVSRGILLVERAQKLRDGLRNRWFAHRDSSALLRFERG
jgi:hypothetical protein